jgi:hypothetical protein
MLAKGAGNTPVILDCQANERDHLAQSNMRVAGDTVVGATRTASTERLERKYSTWMDLLFACSTPMLADRIRN